MNGVTERKWYNFNLDYVQYATTDCTSACMYGYMITDYIHYSVQLKMLNTGIRISLYASTKCEWHYICVAEYRQC